MGVALQVLRNPGSGPAAGGLLYPNPRPGASRRSQLDTPSSPFRAAPWLEAEEGEGLGLARSVCP